MYLRLLEDKNESLALLLIDIDGFKDVNDTYSHKSEMPCSNKCHSY